MLEARRVLSKPKSGDVLTSLYVDTLRDLSEAAQTSVVAPNTRVYRGAQGGTVFAVDETPPGAGNTTFFAALTAEDPDNPGVYAWERVVPVATGGDLDLGGYWKRTGEASVDEDDNTIYTAYESDGQEAILTLYTNLGLVPVFQLFPAGLDADGNDAYVFHEPYITGDVELFCKITGNSVVTADSKWTYSGYYCRWDGTDWQVLSGSPFSNLLNTYEPVIGGSVYTNGVDPADISGTSIVPQPIAPGVYRMHRVPIYDTETLTSITGYTFMISEPNGMSGACS